MGRKKHKKKKSATFNKKSLTNSILGLFSNNPKKTFNHKQISKRLQITDTSTRKLVVEVLAELTESNDLEEIYSGKYKLSPGGHVIGKVKLLPAVMDL